VPPNGQTSGDYIVDTTAPSIDSAECADDSSPRAGAPVDEIEITSGMIEAGASVLCAYETLTAGEEYWAKAVYRAMESRRRLELIY
jgi:hypothetical protein